MPATLMLIWRGLSLASICAAPGRAATFALTRVIKESAIRSDRSVDICIHGDITCRGRLDSELHPGAARGDSSSPLKLSGTNKVFTPSPATNQRYRTLVARENRPRELLIAVPKNFMKERHPKPRIDHIATI